jgi:ketosteroid isomerase-like protein
MTTHAPNDTERFVGPADDVAAVLQCHRDWWAGNHTLEIPRVSRNFAPDTLMFNLNGHTYYSLAEMVQLWQYYTGVLAIDLVPLWDIRVFVSGDLAYVTSEGSLPTKAVVDDAWAASNVELGAPDTAALDIYFRETSVFRRDDGNGNPVWKIWHFHCSPMSSIDEQRPGFEDSWRGRAEQRGEAVLQTPELPL